MQTKEIHLLTQNLGNQCINNGYKLVIAESCTGGLVCSTITSVSGSSKWFERDSLPIQTNPNVIS